MHLPELTWLPYHRFSLSNIRRRMSNVGILLYNVTTQEWRMVGTGAISLVFSALLVFWALSGGSKAKGPPPTPVVATVTTAAPTVERLAAALPGLPEPTASTTASAPVTTLVTMKPTASAPDAADQRIVLLEQKIAALGDQVKTLKRNAGTPTRVAAASTSRHYNRRNYSKNRYRPRRASYDWW
jgi:hypothetical protein